MDLPGRTGQGGDHIISPWLPGQNILLSSSPNEWLADHHQVYPPLDLVDELDISEFEIPAQIKHTSGGKGSHP